RLSRHRRPWAQRSSALRRHLAELRTRRPDCADLLNELETLTASFRMELIRRRLETVLTASP
ncbi:MAG TPA: hypothetical protein PKY38_09675, partial [Opitutaceae bacterium]|nr:hypothetical protein [Opitutaceae bacterium]